MKSIFAGILISIGGSVFLACDNKYIGSLMFAVALICICYRGDNLFTGRVCYVPVKHPKGYIKSVLGGLIGNLATTILFGKILMITRFDLSESAKIICEQKLSQLPVETAIRSMMCGILIFLAVDIFGRYKTPIGILFCVPVFILSGWEHCIADSFYLSIADAPILESIKFLTIAILGNAIGGMLIPSCERMLNNEL